MRYMIGEIEIFLDEAYYSEGNGYMITFKTDRNILFKFPIKIKIEDQLVTSPMIYNYLNLLILDLMIEINNSELLGQAITDDWKWRLYYFVSEKLGLD